MVGTTSLKNKTYEEIYGKERAKEMREIKRIKTKEWHRKNKDTEEYKERGRNIGKSNKGKLAPNKLNLPEKTIINLYDKISSNKIAKLFNCSSTPIYRILKENNIKIKGTKFFNKGEPSHKRLNLDKNKIIDMYINQDISGVQIAKEFNCSLSVIYRILKRNCIELKGVKFFNKGKLGWNKNKKIDKEIYPNYGMRNKNHKIKSRIKQSASHQGIPLEKWKKFIGREPYDQNFDNKFKRAVRKRDNQVCMLCGIHKEKLSRALDVHHINGDKKMSLLQNGISLCQKCHMGIVHANKKKLNYWKTFFQSLLAKEYDYQYSGEGEIILNLNQK